MSALVARFRA